jgi:hypothetical protein
MSTTKHTPGKGLMQTALLFCDDVPAPLGPRNDLLPLDGRPLLQRAVETLVRAGVSHINVLAASGGDAVRAFLGDGERWGVTLSYLQRRDDERIADLARRSGITAEQRYLLASAASVPLFDRERAQNLAGLSYAGGAWVWQQAGRERWTGWAGVAGSWLLTSHAPADSTGLASAIMGSSTVIRFVVERPLQCARPVDLLAAHRAVLDSAGSERGPGRGSRIHPSARLLGPVSIGRNVQIGPRAVVGPHASIGDDAILAADTAVADAIVAPGTYVGRGLELRHGIACGERYANARLDVVLELREPELLSAAGPDAPARGLRRRAGAALSAAASAATAALRGPRPINQ